MSTMTGSEVIENDEELAARLHRELNGLNRRTGRIAAAAAVGTLRRRRSKAARKRNDTTASSSHPVASPVGSSSGLLKPSTPGSLQEEHDTSTTPTGPEALSLETYAASACRAASISCDKATLQPGMQTGPSLKCFVAGYRWGIAVRRSLATKRKVLTAHLTSIIASYADGDTHCVNLQHECSAVLLNGEGQQYYFPANGADTTHNWQSVVKSATRAYFL